MAKLSDRLQFGKYKGKTIKEVADADPVYLAWAHLKTDIFCLGDKNSETYKYVYRKQKAVLNKRSDNLEASAYSFPDIKF